jgi:peptide/nickel transport system permease protein
MSILTFGLVRLTGNPLDLMMSMYATPEDYEAMSKHLGLDQPLVIQYWSFIKHAAHGDFGKSLFYKRPSMEVVFDRLPATLQLASASMLMAIIIAVPIGVISAVKRDTAMDGVSKLGAVLGQSIPNFWLGIVLIELISVKLGILPVAGRGGLTHLILPALTMGWYIAAGIMRLTRSSMLDVLNSEYVKFTRIKGLPERAVIWKHALKNAFIPVLTFISLMLAQLLMGSIVVETVFAWPGVGRLAYQSVLSRDFPLVQAIVVVYTTIYVVTNLLVDVAYAYLDPRIRY